MKQRIGSIVGLFLVSLLWLSVNPGSDVAASSLEGYGQTGFYGHYQKPSEHGAGDLTGQEKAESGIIKSEKIPNAGDAPKMQYVLIAVLPLLLMSFYFKQLHNETRQG